MKNLKGFDMSSEEGYLLANSDTPIYGEELLTYCQKRRRMSEDNYVNNKGRFNSDPYNIDMWDLRIEALKNPNVYDGKIAYLVDENNEKINAPILSNQIGAFFISKDFLPNAPEGKDKYISQWVRLENFPECEEEEIYVSVRGTNENPIISYYCEDTERWYNQKPEDLDYDLEIEPIEDFQKRINKFSGYKLIIKETKLFTWYKVTTIGRKISVTSYGIPCNYLTGEKYLGE